MPTGGADEYYDDVDEGIIESLIIISLAGALAFLVYYRNQRQTNHRREVERLQQQLQPEAADQDQPNQPNQQGQQNEPAPQGQLGHLGVDQQQANGGFFPPPGDPGYAQWVAGGVGH